MSDIDRESKEYKLLEKEGFIFSELDVSFKEIKTYGLDGAIIKVTCKCGYSDSMLLFKHLMIKHLNKNGKLKIASIFNMQRNQNNNFNNHKCIKHN